MNVSDMIVSDEDGYLSRGKTFSFKQQDCERANLDRFEVDNSESCSERSTLNRTRESRTYSKSSRLHVRMVKKSEHEQEASNESFMYDKWFAGVTRRIRRNHKKRLVV